MTMPHLMNCGHSEDGWCLDCVKKLYDEKENRRRENKLGEIPTQAGIRDAVHVPIISAVAGEDLATGYFVRIDSDGAAWIDTSNAVGVIDPYAGRVLKGSLVWVCLFPGSITGLRHVWTHPAFKDQPPQSHQEETVTTNVLSPDVGVLVTAAGACGMGLNMFLCLIDNWIESGGEPWIEYGSENARSGWYQVDRDRDNFWSAWERVTGKTRPNIDDLNWSEPFTCSC